MAKPFKTYEIPKRKQFGKKAQTYRLAQCNSVIDGDTYDLQILLEAFSNLCVSFADRRIRLAGLDTPEIKTPAGKKVASIVTNMFYYADGGEVDIFATDKYGRYLAEVKLFYGPVSVVNLRGFLLNEGLADFYDGGERAWTADALETVERKCTELSNVLSVCIGALRAVKPGKVGE